jgi:hypothetical protein
MAWAADLRRGGRWDLPLVIAELPAWAAALDIDTPADLEQARVLWPTVEPILATWCPSIHHIGQLRQEGACAVSS